MATAHHQSRAGGGPLPRMLAAVAGAGAAAILLLLAVRAVFGTDTAAFPTTVAVTAAHPRPTTPPPPPRDPAGKDSRFVAVLTERAGQGGYPAGNREEMLAGARQVCAMVTSGVPVRDAAAVVMHGYDLTGMQAAGMAEAALEVYCPQARR